MVVCAVREDVGVLPVDRVTSRPGMLSQCKRVEICHLDCSLVPSSLASYKSPECFVCIQLLTDGGGCMATEILSSLSLELASV